jgi:hypothetical protein
MAYTINMFVFELNGVYLGYECLKELGRSKGPLNLISIGPICNPKGAADLMDLSKEMLFARIFGESIYFKERNLSLPR